MSDLPLGMLYDSRGNLMPPGDQRKIAEEKLKAYIEKYKSRFADWFREKGATTRPPVYYDLSKQEWFWRD